MRTLAALFVAMIPAVAVAAAAAAECTVRSGPTANVVVELYTSEGCDSCPPADRWFSRLGAERVVPLAFHVDYWDYLGWKDRFASPRYSQRQRDLAGLARTTRIYTPQVMVQGRDLSRWSDDAAFARRLAESTGKPASASIAITSQPPMDNKLVATLEVTLAAGVKPEEVAAYVGLVESGLSSRVTAGENSGATLAHDHVVRAFDRLRLSGRNSRLSASLPLAKDARADRSALFVVVQDLRTGEVLQALRAPACRS